MGYTLNGGHHYESTKTTSKDLAIKIWKHRESEITLRLFKVGWQGERIAFGQLCEEFERSHFAGLAANTVRGHRTYIKNLKAFFGDCKLGRITVEMIEKYRDQRRQQPTKRGPNRKVKGATVNRELECLKCVLDLACKRKYIPENPASSVKHFNELRERPALDQENRYTLVAQPGELEQLEKLGPNFHPVAIAGNDRGLQHNLQIPGYLRSLKPSLFHIPLNSVPWRMPRPYVLTIHDMSTLLFPEQKTFRSTLHQERYRRGAARAALPSCARGGGGDVRALPGRPSGRRDRSALPAASVGGPAFRGDQPGTGQVVACPVGSARPAFYVRLRGCLSRFCLLQAM